MAPPAGLTIAVLAGGRSLRFGADKLTYRWRGRSVLDRTLGALAPLQGRVFLLVPSIRYGQRILSSVSHAVEWWPDPPHSRHPGPAAVVASALPRIPGEWLLVVPGDQPFLEPGALLRWWELARSLPAEVTSLWDPRDRIQPAFQLHRLTRTRPLGRRLLEGPVPDLRMSSLLRASARCALVDLRGLTEHPWSFRSLNRPRDRRRPPTTPAREVPEPPHWIGPSASNLFWRGLAAYRKGDRPQTYLAFFEEAKTHATGGRWLLSLHALEDSHRAPFRSA